MLAPPLLVSYSSLDEYLEALDPELLNLYGKDIKNLFERGLPPVVSFRCLAVLFGYSTKFVHTLSQRNSTYYREFKIRHTKRKFRKIQAPKVALKVIQKWFGFHLAKALTFDEYVFGFIPGKSAPDAAAQHVNAKWVYSVDIIDFFRNTPQEAVATALVDLGYSSHAAEILAGLLCYKKFLAQGSPASPIVSNLAFKEIDNKLNAIAHQHNIRFTRYADDIVFSGTEEIPENLKNQVDEIFENEYWELSEEKKYCAKLPQRLKVHGLLVHGEKVRLTKGYRNKIRAYKHLLASGKIKEKDKSRIEGHIKYADSIEKIE